MLKTEGGKTILYVNKYYEKNLDTGEVTTHYFLGDREIAYRKGSTLEYICQDHLGSTAVTVNTSGTAVARIAYFPFGGTRSLTGGLNTDKRFTGQRLDETGLYFYNARYYDATIGRFISADTVAPDYKDPQDLNPYAYCRNNPLRYVDPSGRFFVFVAGALSIGCVTIAARVAVYGPSLTNYWYRISPWVMEKVVPLVAGSFSQPPGGAGQGMGDAIVNPLLSEARRAVNKMVQTTSELTQSVSTGVKRLWSWVSSPFRRRR